MNLFDYFKKNIHMYKIKKFDGDMREIAIVRYVMKEASKFFYRDYTFFLNKENINARDSLYNKKIDLNNIQDFSIVCKSYCNVIKELLKKNFDIDSELISPFDDKFRHVDLLIITENGNRYIVDPLTDLIEMQVGLRTNNFASANYYNNTYLGKISDISFLTDEELEKIDDEIDYKINNSYLNDCFEMINKRFKAIEKERGNSNLSVDKKIELKLQFISKFLNDRRNINGFVDYLIFSSIVIENLFSKEEQEKIHSDSFFVDKQDLKDNDLKNMLINKEDRKRGIVISFNGRNYIFSLSSNSLEYNDDEWKKIVEENNIFIKPHYPVKLLKYLKNNGADRNIVHNNEFLRLFNKFETYLLNNGQSLEDIKDNNVFIQNGMIFTIFENSSISYKIENGNLVIKDYKKNIKRTVFYEDEGRDISYQDEVILKNSEKVNLYEFDSNGLIDLDEVTGIEDLVVSLNNEKYLSRNASYYEARTYSELACERKRLGKILTEDASKKNFVILEYLSNASAKIYFEELKKKIDNQDNNVIEAQKCFEEDCENLVRLFRNEPLLKPIYNLPEGNDRILERHIEMDNKQILYMFCSNIKFNKAKHILTPGLGSIFVGPMLKSMYGFDYTNILFSLYSKDEKLRNISAQKSFDDMFSNDLWSTTENELILIDDNVGSCNTMNTIRRQLQERGKSCKYGAIKYNWDFYNQVKHGELEHPTFNVKDVDFLTILDDPGYWIMRDSIKALKEKGGDAYVEVMKQEGLRQEKNPDIQVLMQLAEKHSQSAGVDLYNMEGGQIKKSSAFLCKKLKGQILEMIRDKESQDLGER